MMTQMFLQQNNNANEVLGENSLQVKNMKIMDHLKDLMELRRDKIRRDISRFSNWYTDFLTLIDKKYSDRNIINEKFFAGKYLYGKEGF